MKPGDMLVVPGKGMPDPQTSEIFKINIVVIRCVFAYVEAEQTEQEARKSVCGDWGWLQFTDVDNGKCWNLCFCFAGGLPEGNPGQQFLSLLWISLRRISTHLQAFFNMLSEADRTWLGCLGESFPRMELCCICIGKISPLGHTKMLGGQWRSCTTAVTTAGTWSKLSRKLNVYAGKVAGAKSQGVLATVKISVTCPFALPLLGEQVKRI